MSEEIINSKLKQAIKKDKSQVDSNDRLMSAKIRKFRLERAMSQEEVAKILGVSIQQMQKYETARNRLSVGRLYSLAKAFKIPIINLFDVTDSDYTINEIRESNRGIKMLKYFDKLDNRTQQSLLGLMRSILKKEEEEDESKRTE